MTDWRREISLAAEIGGGQVPKRVMSSITRLRLMLSEYCRGPYSEDVLGIALALRVDGEVKQYHFEGVDDIRRNKKEKYIGADIGIPDARWKYLSDDAFAEYLFGSVKAAIEACLQRLRRDKVNMDEDRLRSDLAKVEARFLASNNRVASS